MINLFCLTFCPNRCWLLQLNADTTVAEPSLINFEENLLRKVKSFLVKGTPNFLRNIPLVLRSQYNLSIQLCSIFLESSLYIYTFYFLMFQCLLTMILHLYKIQLTYSSIGEYFRAIFISTFFLEYSSCVELIKEIYS